MVVHLARNAQKWTGGGCANAAWNESLASLFSRQRFGVARGAAK